MAFSKQMLLCPAIRNAILKPPWMIKFRKYSENIEKLRNRGLIQDIFPADSSKFPVIKSSKPAAIYAGFDPTADSLHIGHLLVIMAMIHCQKAGYQIIALIGGATTQIGDPTGKTKDRQELDQEIILENSSCIQKKLQSIFNNYEKYVLKYPSSSLYPVKFCNNLDWYNKMNAVDFLRDVGGKFRMGMLLSKQSVQLRLNSNEGLSFKEFSYQIFQAYDWLYLFDNYNCLVQIGGSDQMGNIHSGHELISRVRNQNVYGVMVPLVTSETGDKFGKTAGNAVWLDGNKTTPFELYQFFIKLKDDEIEKYLKFFTFLSLDEISSIMSEQKRHPERRIAQTRLAKEVTLLIHGEQGLKSATRVTDVLFSKTRESLLDVSENELQEIFREAKACDLMLEPELTILQMALKAGCFSSDESARRIIKAGGFYINHRRVVTPDTNLVPEEHILPNKLSLLRCGKFF